MQIVKENLIIHYEIKDADIRATAAGVMDGRSYGSSVRLTVTNLYESVNEKTQFTNDIKQEVSFKIPCLDDLTAGKIGRFFKEKFKAGESVVINGGIPDRNGVVTVLNPVESFLAPAAKSESKKN